jgi:hypothetical protein
MGATDVRWENPGRDGLPTLATTKSFNSAALACEPSERSRLLDLSLNGTAGPKHGQN